MICCPTCSVVLSWACVPSGVPHGAVWSRRTRTGTRKMTIITIRHHYYDYMTEYTHCWPLVSWLATVDAPQRSPCGNTSPHSHYYRYYQWVMMTRVVVMMRVMVWWHSSYSSNWLDSPCASVHWHWVMTWDHVPYRIMVCIDCLTCSWHLLLLLLLLLWLLLVLLLWVVMMMMMSPRPQRQQWRRLQLLTALWHTMMIIIIIITIQHWPFHCCCHCCTCASICSWHVSLC